MGPPQSGQMAKSAAVSGQSPLVRLAIELGGGTRVANIEQPMAQSEAVAAGAVGEEAVVADAMTEVTTIDVKIVIPFPDTSSFFAVFEKIA